MVLHLNRHPVDLCLLLIQAFAQSDAHVGSLG